MKRIIVSLSIIVAAAAVVIGATTAYFSDTEISTGNTFTAGTIDIAVDGQNPWEDSTTLHVEDMKPSQHEYTEYVIHNVGTNPANVWKTIYDIEDGEGIWSEPKCDAYGGNWDETNGNGTCDYDEDVNSLSGKIIYDMSVWVYNEDPEENEDAEPIWWQVIYTDEMGVTLNDVKNDAVLLGMIPADWYMVVQQSYHMDKNAGNKYQGNEMFFDIELYAKQLTNTVVLENKDFPAGEEPTIVDDDRYAEVTYDVKDAEFNYELSVYDMPDGDYTLIAWPENGQAFAWSDVVNAIGLVNVTVSGDTVVSGSINLDRDLINAKLWLVSGTLPLGQEVGTFGWSEDWLFETALMDYYDSLQ